MASSDNTNKRRRKINYELAYYDMEDKLDIEQQRVAHLLDDIATLQDRLMECGGGDLNDNNDIMSHAYRKITNSKKLMRHYTTIAEEAAEESGSESESESE